MMKNRTGHHLAPHKWLPASMGGGGYITGMIQHPVQEGTLYARCDVAGVFRSRDGGETWEAMNGSLQQAHHHQVQSFAISLHRPDVLFRCSGEVRGKRFTGSIHKSSDGGRSWREVCRTLGFYGNGPTRMYGEVIDVDPFTPDIVAAGGYTGGLQISRDEGESWTPSPLPEERFGCVVFHPYRAGVLYAGTISDDDLNMDYADVGEGGVIDLLQDIPRGIKGRLYASNDHGETWQLLHEGLSFAELAFDERDPGLIHAACIWNGVMRSADGGRTWQRVENGLLPGRRRFGCIVRDPHDPEALYTAPDIRPDMEGLPPIPIYLSIDCGAQWSLVRHHADGDLSGFPQYMDRFGGGSRAAAAGWAIAKIRVDRFRPGRLYMCNWYGVAISDDGGLTWRANRFKGLETTCMEAVVADPCKPGAFYVTMADHPPKATEDGGRTFRNLPGFTGYSGSTAIAITGSGGGKLLYGLVGHHRTACIAHSDDGGRTASIVLSLPPGLFVQALREDGGREGTFYAYVDGPVADGAGVYRSIDGGAGWVRTAFRPPAPITRLPHRADWIESELLSVVVYQIKNACGSNQLLDTDPLQPGRLAVGEWTEGLWLSEDGGDSWRSIGEGLPFGRNGPASVLSVVRFSPTCPGTLYAGFIKEGVWRSGDCGRTWTKLYPADDDGAFNATALAVCGSGGTDRLIAASEPTVWAAQSSSVLFSPDGGGSWQELTDARIGAVRWKGVAFDSTGRQAMGVTCGNGAFRASLPE